MHRQSTQEGPPEGDHAGPGQRRSRFQRGQRGCPTAAAFAASCGSHGSSGLTEVLVVRRDSTAAMGVHGLGVQWERCTASRS